MMQLRTGHKPKRSSAFLNAGIPAHAGFALKVLLFGSFSPAVHKSTLRAQNAHSPGFWPSGCSSPTGRMLFSMWGKICLWCFGRSSIYSPRHLLRWCCFEDIGLWLTKRIIPGLLKQNGPLRQYCLSQKTAKASVLIAGHAANCRMSVHSSSTTQTAKLPVLFTRFVRTTAENIRGPTLS
jgi:hypothetical protein